MKQRRRRSGQRIHTSRARTRGRHDVVELPRGEPHALLDQWLEAHIGNCSPEESHRLELKGYLQHTQHIDLSPAERLRQLAIALEPGLNCEARGHQALMRIYSYAQRLEPGDALLLHSRGLVLQRYAECLEFESRANSRALYEAALAAFREAHAHATEPAMRAASLYSAGYGVYLASHRTTAEALELFEEALVEDPTEPWALLYRAHCLHDLERWGEAVEAYEAVPHAFFNGPRSWRMHTLVEQRGYCRWRAGDREGALSDLTTIARRYGKQPHLADYSGLVYLRKACEADALRETLEPLVAHVLARCGLPPLGGRFSG